MLSRIHSSLFHSKKAPAPNQLQVLLENPLRLVQCLEEAIKDYVDDPPYYGSQEGELKAARECLATLRGETNRHVMLQKIKKLFDQFNDWSEDSLANCILSNMGVQAQFGWYEYATYFWNKHEQVFKAAWQQVYQFSEASLKSEREWQKLAVIIAAVRSVQQAPADSKFMATSVLNVIPSILQLTAETIPPADRKGDAPTPR